MSPLFTPSWTLGYGLSFPHSHVWNFLCLQLEAPITSTTWSGFQKHSCWSREGTWFRSWQRGPNGENTLLQFFTTWQSRNSDLYMQFNVFSCQNFRPPAQTRKIHTYKYLLSYWFHSIHKWRILCTSKKGRCTLHKVLKPYELRLQTSMHTKLWT